MPARETDGCVISVANRPHSEHFGVSNHYLPGAPSIFVAELSVLSLSESGRMLRVDVDRESASPVRSFRDVRLAPQTARYWFVSQDPSWIRPQVGFWHKEPLALPDVGLVPPTQAFLTP
jgi:hypothetical protein